MKILNKFISNLSVASYYLKSDLIKKQRDFKIGLFAVFLVVFFLTILLNAIQYSATIFIKLSEENNSEIDLILTSSLQNQNVETKKSIFDTYFYQKKTITYSNTSNYNLSNLNFLNFYEIKEKLANLSFIEGISPRWFILGKASHTNKETKDSNEFNTNILILDSSKENNIGLGRTLNLPELKLYECYISKTLADALKVKSGDTITMQIRLSDLIKTFFFGGSGKEDANTFDDLWDDDSGDHIINKIKRKGFSGKLKDDFENEENLENENITDNSKININLGINILNKNKIKDMKKLIINYGPIKQIINTVTYQYFNLIITNLKKTIEFINVFSPVKFNLNDLKTFSFKKSYLKDPLIKDFSFIQELDNILFPVNEKEEEEINKDMFTRIKNNMIRKIFIYNNKTGLISLDSYLVDIFLSENITDVLENNQYFEELLDQELILDNITKFININLNLTIVETIKSNGGKWPSSSGNVLAIDSRHIKEYLHLNSKLLFDELINSLQIESIKKTLRDSIDNSINNLDLNKYSLSINILLKDKFEIYKKDNPELRHYFAEISEKIIRSLGIKYKLNIKAPIFTAISSFQTLKTFLKDIFIGIMVFLWMLSVLLVYSLMLGNVDERTYEFGMMRSLGFKKNNLIYLVLLKGIFFAIPGIILGLISSYIINIFISFLFNWFSGLVMPFYISKSNMAFGIVIGLSIPLISSYLPIKKCLGNNLRDALTLFNNKKLGDIVVTMIKLENMGISPSASIASITLIVIGILTYYLCPLSYLLNDLSMFLFIMIIILITMLLGLIILSQLIIPYLQILLLKLAMFLNLKDQKFHLIILKNLEGHKRRNRQISIMFVLALGFVIFSGCSLNLVVDLIEQMTKSLLGGDFSIYVLNKNHPNMTLDEITMNNYLKNISKYYPNLIKNYSYYSWPLNEILEAENIIFKSYLSSLNGYPSIKKGFAAIDQNYIESSYESIYHLSEYDKNSNISYTTDDRIDIIKMLSNNSNKPNILEENNNIFIYPENKNLKTIKNFQLNIFIAEGIKKILGINIENPAQLTLSSNSEQFPEQNIPCKIIGTLSKLPGIIDYSSYKGFSKSSSVYTSLEQFKQLINLEANMFNIKMQDLSNVTVDGIRKKRFILKYKDNSKKELKEMVYFGMLNYLEDLVIYHIQLDEIMKTVIEIKNVIEYIFLVLGLISLILSFFLIWTSFYNNIRENIAEYGIMRSIGVTKSQSVRIYLYEAAVIIIASTIVGTILGIIISSSIILQFDIFFELPFIFNFPFKVYFILIIVGLFLGLLGSYYPIYDVNKINLVKIMKGFNE